MVHEYYKSPTYPSKSSDSALYANAKNVFHLLSLSLLRKGGVLAI